MKTCPLIALFSAILLTAFLQPADARAQIHELRQTVFGMDCAPCAHGLQKRLGRIEGVTDVKVSLNEGTAELEFEAGNQVRLETIRAAIEESGFAAKDATIRVSGILEKEHGQVVLVSSTGDRFALEQSAREPAAFRRVNSAAAATEITVTGLIPGGQGSEQARWVLQVLDARS